MKRSTVFSLRQIGITDFLNKNKIFLLMAITFAVGCIAASFIYPENKKLQGIISDYFLNFLSHRIDKKFFNVFISSFLELAFYMLVIFLGGSSMFGVVLIPFIVLIRGLYYGGFSALLYSEFALKGVAFNALVFIPPALIFTLCIFFAAKESINLSLRLARISLSNSLPSNISLEFKNYSGKYILFLFVSLISALIDAGLSTSLMQFFNF